jgi:uncharacterized BrkB/YihY/UPF0761 family membrane protein
MDLGMFLKTVIWLPLFMLAGYAAPQFMFGTNPFYGFIGMMVGLMVWLLMFTVLYLKGEN